MPLRLHLLLASSVHTDHSEFELLKQENRRLRSSDDQAWENQWSLLSFIYQNPAPRFPFITRIVLDLFMNRSIVSSQYTNSDKSIDQPSANENFKCFLGFVELFEQADCFTVHKIVLA